LDKLFEVSQSVKDDSPQRNCDECQRKEINHEGHKVSQKEKEQKN
jgi:hypothetical protein